MGKVDDMRAMREARYAALSKSQARRVAIQMKPLEDREDEVAARTDASPVVVTCGHRAISGKTCTRPKDHTEKNHRYT